ncbi:hypothetical protein [Chitinophaga barathri]|uniref:hypothetical protein n=1 Tax=Chitinophaga barathri TaxID=1647451 RepID=UPI0013C51FEE|nr:hypothetical protein [Chitinophaga barathri]
MTTFLIIAGAFLALFMLMLAVLVTLMLLHMHRSSLPTELACVPKYYEDGHIWEGTA